MPVSLPNGPILLPDGKVLIVAGKVNVAAELCCCVCCVRFEACIDGSDIVHIKGTSLWIEHLTWSLPGAGSPCSFSTIKINGVDWTPTWSVDPDTGNQTTEEFSIGCSAGSATQADLSGVTERDPGRVSVIQQPDAGNDYETQILIDDDAPTGAYTYAFTVCFSTP